MKWTVLCLLVALAIIAPCFAANQTRLIPTWNVPRPVDMTTDGISNRVYIVSQFGVVYWIDNTNASDNPISTNSSSFHMFLNVTDQVLCCTTPDDERGLLGIAFPPNYMESRRVYIYFGGQPAGGTTYQTNYILRYTAMEDFSRVDPSSRKVIWQLDHPFPNHNGGQIRFGPDGYLYVSLGDGGNGGDPFNNGQDLGTQWGKVIRIDVNVTGNATYNIPPTNPFADTNTTMIRREIWAYGLRNPYRFSFDKESGLMFSSDAGQNIWEEINVIRKGGNYGWNIVEGPACFEPPTGCNRTGLIEPIFSYNHSLPFLNPEDIVVIGGYVYRGQRVDLIRGKYLFADALAGVIWAMTFNSSDPYDNTVEIIFQQNLLFISGFGVDQNREIYVLSLLGTVYRVASL